MWNFYSRYRSIQRDWQLFDRMAPLLRNLQLPQCLTYTARIYKKLWELLVSLDFCWERLKGIDSCPCWCCPSRWKRDPRILRSLPWLGSYPKGCQDGPILLDSRLKSKACIWMFREAGCWHSALYFYSRKGRSRSARRRQTVSKPNCPLPAESSGCSLPERAASRGPVECSASKDRKAEATDG